MTSVTDSRLWALLQAHRDTQPYPPSDRRIAARLGISPTALTNWRTGLSALPKRTNLEALAALAGVPYRQVLAAALHDAGYLDAEGE
jgi:transcriptional regulator with XRE-family HTH domain